jgi:sialic acid synthase SpsE
MRRENVVVVAEMSANHCQDFSTAVELVLAAKWAGADAVKVQMFTPDVMADPNDAVVQEGLWQGKTLYEIYKKACMPYEWVPKLKGIAEELGLFFFTSVYDLDTVDVAEEMGIPAYKISSFEIPHIPLIEKVAKTGKTLIMSTGMADFEEMWKALKTARNHTKDVWLLHCVSQYPADPKEMNLRTIMDLGRYCRGKAGLSDHTLGISVPVTAVGMGAQMIEKHLKVNEFGLDAAFSLSPSQFKEMVEAVRAAEASIGGVKYGGKKKFRRVEKDGKWIRTVNSGGIARP